MRKARPLSIDIYSNVIVTYTIKFVDIIIEKIRIERWTVCR